MTTLKLFILTLISLTANGLPNPPVTRNTIFMDEKVEGAIFEHVDDFENIEYNLPAESYRLPTTTRPVHYNLLWGVDIARFVLSGTVDITLQPTQGNVSEIVIHSHDLNHTQIILRQSNNNQAISHNVVVDSERQFLRIALTSGSLVFNPSVTYTLSISFEALLRDDMYGIYRSWFKNNQASTDVSWMASTQFQATAARYAFPCYDEPGFKARFDITIRRPTNFRSWSCTNQRQTVNSIPGFQDDVYETTPIMSTYLLALVVASGYSNTAPVMSPNNTLRYEVIARQTAITEGQGSYAMQFGQQLVNIMSQHTNIEYFDMDPNVKMTHAAIPDFSAGAMENWGLITYREAYLMYNPLHTNDYFKQLIAYILSHEIAHMWFGNLVTCAFWDNLWLNEGFARYYQYFLTHWADATMGLSTRFINEQMHTALLFDSSETAHPLTNPNVGSPASISSMFSTISYNKGAAIIRMTEHLLGSSVHEQGLRNLLVLRTNDVVRPIDLFQALDDAGRAAGAFSVYGSDFSFIDYYRSWTEQSGHPILNVQVNHHTGDMIITQRRFSINNGYATQNLNYIIPISFATASNPNFDNVKPTHIISNSISVINRNSTGDQWVIFNKQQTGFYRVNYDEYTWNLIILALRGPDRTLIHPYNRAQIVDDVFQFARAGLMTYNRAFNILSFLANETEYAPWVAAITGFNWLRNRLAGTAYLPRLNERIISWASNIMGQLTYYPTQGESFMRSYLRYQLAPLMCNLGVPACLQAASQQFNALVTSGVEVPPNSRNWVYCNGLRQGSNADFDFLFNRYLQHNTYNEKILILQMLGCTTQQQSLNRLLDNIIQENYVVRPQDYSVAYNGALNGAPGNPSLVLNYIRTRPTDVINAFGSASPFTSAISRLTTPAAINEIRVWANQNQAILGDYYQSVITSSESTLQGLQWVNTIADQLEDYFTVGDVAVTPSSVVVPPVTQPVTVTPSTLIPPVTPNLPDSAVTSVLSIAVLVLAFVVNIIV